MSQLQKDLMKPYNTKDLLIYFFSLFKGVAHEIQERVD